MMMNLFSVFDPATSINFSMNWFSSLFIMLFLPKMYWLIPSRFNVFFYIINNSLNNEFKMLMNKNINFNNLIIYISMFYMIMMNNLLGMFPYIYTSSSHLSFSLSLSLTLWMSFMVFGWLYHTDHMFIHLVPQGTPSNLMSFMVLIETISNVIRPGTLAVRLSANMIAGHLLMTLISSTGPNLSLIILMLMIISQCLLIVLELSVAIIQAYVFTVLSILYSVESN